MDANNPNKSFRTTPEYAEYQRENFWQDNEGKTAPFNTRKPFSPHLIQYILTRSLRRPGQARGACKGKALRRRLVLCGV